MHSFLSGTNCADSHAHAMSAWARPPRTTSQPLMRCPVNTSAKAGYRRWCAIHDLCDVAHWQAGSETGGFDAEPTCPACPHIDSTGPHNQTYSGHFQTMSRSLRRKSCLLRLCKSPVVNDGQLCFCMNSAPPVAALPQARDRQQLQHPFPHPQHAVLPPRGPLQRGPGPRGVRGRRLRTCDPRVPRTRRRQRVQVRGACTTTTGLSP